MTRADTRPSFCRSPLWQRWHQLTLRLYALTDSASCCDADLARQVRTSARRVGGLLAISWWVCEQTREDGGVLREVLSGCAALQQALILLVDLGGLPPADGEQLIEQIEQLRLSLARRIELDASPRVERSPQVRTTRLDGGSQLPTLQRARSQHERATSIERRRR